ncbi:MAG: TIM barrel protein [Lachnospiraceae bacterium]|nr:TIM barrel protein [Lachnospiraceae bacterium]
MNYSVCIDALFHGEPVDKVLPLVKKCGYNAIEFWTWWDKDMNLLKDLCSSLNLKVVTFCTDFRINPGNAADHDRYLEGLALSIEEAKKLNCPMLIAQAGWEIEGISFESHEDALIKVMQDALPLLTKENMTLVLEPLNVLTDHPGYHMSTSAHAFSFLKKINDPHIKILFDIYHQQITEGNILANIKEHLPQIGHFHIAAVPGRTTPTAGELNYPCILENIKEMGYNQYFGLEYMPKEDPLKTLQEVYGAFPK